MGLWTTGVSVVTALGSGGPAGATANAFTSLSLEPPLLLICLDVRSRTLRAARGSGRFCVNILAAGQEDVSRLFATKKSQGDKFAEISYRLNYGAPVIDGCLATIVCGLDSELRCGDHLVLIGRVLHADINEGAAPLIFYRSNYQTLPEMSPMRPLIRTRPAGPDGAPDPVFY
jgi:3-hydroxy-9,10-secoandrosta-1,3,5(10)-triene-9,17-dione monooxygenase reductase component